MMQGVHYQRLGVVPTATPEEIRTAYRNLARVHHPDKHEGKTSIQMLEINEAWRVLSDPVLRYKYDADLRAHRNEVDESEVQQRRERLQNFAVDAERRRYSPAKFPWRFVVAVIVLGTILILVLGAFSKPGEPAPIDNVLRVGSCVAINEFQQEAYEVSCAEAHAGVVQQIIPFDAVCSYPLVAYRDRQGMG
ncbi:MAG: DnaJ domain-containing protein, partial [Actinobacteria bacterium]|nr:DnaJ domain-containing protein [Actinomycetota bacterium]MSZ71886.1 DnaJ domain-containing protein [Actinomycetota bacterium]